jgi:hypothetical protein
MTLKLLEVRKIGTEFVHFLDIFAANPIEVTVLGPPVSSESVGALIAIDISRQFPCLFSSLSNSGQTHYILEQTIYLVDLKTPCSKLSNILD